MIIGVLAIQGDFQLHQKMLNKLGVDNIQVRTVGELRKCDGLIIPGGESTTFVKVLKDLNLFNEISTFGKEKPIMGTCAGLITLATKVRNYPIESFRLIDIEVERNAYGRQIDSFIDTVRINLNGKEQEFEGVFIRAPKILKVGEGVNPLGYHGNDVVIAENERILVATFHPELTEDTRIHSYFMEKISGRKG